jgi:hypothetical protein
MRAVCSAHLVLVDLIVPKLFAEMSEITKLSTTHPSEAYSNSTLFSSIFSSFFSNTLPSITKSSFQNVQMHATFCTAKCTTCFYRGATVSPPPNGPWPTNCRGFTITLRHTAVGRTPLDEWSARRKDLYLTTYNTHKTDIHSPGGIRTRNPSKRAAANQRLRQRGQWDRHIT